MTEPDNHMLCVWCLPGSRIPFVVMARIDEYEEDSAPGERWFAADQYFSMSDEKHHGFTWTEVAEKFPQYEGPYLLDLEWSQIYD